MSDNIHHECRKIMAELGKKGEFIFWEDFLWPDKEPITKRLKDVLEDDVDEKYYLSDKVLKANLTHKERHSGRGNGFAFEPKTGEDICGCLATKYGDRPTDTYLKEPNIDMVGLLDIKGADQIRRVYGTDGCSNTLSGAQKDNHLLEPTHRIRKLTPRECLRLQDFPDTFVQTVSNSQMYKQAGNSMSVNILEMIFRQIDKAKAGHSGGLF